MAESKSKKQESYPLTSYTLGILSVATAVSFSILGLILGIIGLVKNKNKGTEYAYTAKVLNIVGIVVSIVVITLNVITLAVQGLPTTGMGIQ